MTGEELARLCFAAQPLLWAIAIIAVLIAVYFLLNGFQQSGFRSDNEENS
jgi:uncharacterized membrane protein